MVYVCMFDTIVGTLKKKYDLFISRLHDDYILYIFTYWNWNILDLQVLRLCLLTLNISYCIITIKKKDNSTVRNCTKQLIKCISLYSFSRAWHLAQQTYLPENYSPSICHHRLFGNLCCCIWERNSCGSHGSPLERIERKLWVNGKPFNR